MRALVVFPNLRALFVYLDPTDLFSMNRGFAYLGVSRLLEDRKGLLYSALRGISLLKTVKTGCPSLPILETAFTMNFAPMVY